MKKFHIWVVDDLSSYARDVATYVGREIGCTFKVISGFSSREELRNTFLRDSPDLIVSDWFFHRSSITGKEIVAELRGLDVGIPLIITSALEGDPRLLDQTELRWYDGNHAWLQKPVKPEKLFELVQKMLRL